MSFMHLDMNLYCSDFPYLRMSNSVPVSTLALFCKQLFRIMVHANSNVLLVSVKFCQI